MEAARTQLESIRDEIRDYWLDDSDMTRHVEKGEPMTTEPRIRNKVFIIHGHDVQLKKEVELFLRTIGFSSFR